MIISTAGGLILILLPRIGVVPYTLSMSLGNPDAESGVVIDDEVL
jgi:hypothetical protein